MGNVSGIPKIETKTSGNIVKVFFYRWFALLYITRDKLGHFHFYIPIQPI